FASWRQDCAAAVPTYGIQRRRYPNHCVADREPSRDVTGSADARPQRPQDDSGFCRHRAIGGAAENAADTDSVRYPRCRARRVEWLEGTVAPHALLRDGIAVDRTLF